MTDRTSTPRELRLARDVREHDTIGGHLYMRPALDAWLRALLKLEGEDRERFRREADTPPFTTWAGQLMTALVNEEYYVAQAERAIEAGEEPPDWLLVQPPRQKIDTRCHFPHDEP